MGLNVQKENILGEMAMKKIYRKSRETEGAIKQREKEAGKTEGWIGLHLRL